MLIGRGGAAGAERAGQDPRGDRGDLAGDLKTYIYIYIYIYTHVYIYTHMYIYIYI